ncbi:hypothetical protein CDN99_03920 [Roseateles aquatilis]|uniref:N-acetyltransferase domain-containing protein n=2 Tax=Roseateles aquatilis TaxID=431061 RepID=A0A246JM07_9BURK|nr:hypothetical protein CDN99_03920 [Roseateles aquatilis]
MPSDDPILIQVPETLETERLFLTCARAGDGIALNLAVVGAIEHLRPWMPWARDIPSAEQSEAVARRMQAQFLLREHLAYFVRLRGPDGRPGRMIGGAGLHTLEWKVRRYEIGYWLAPEFTGHGLAAEAVVALTRLGFEHLHARRMEIRTDARNVASRGVAERCGFTLEGVLRQDALDVKGLPSDTCVYGMTGVDQLLAPTPR